MEKKFLLERSSGSREKMNFLTLLRTNLKHILKIF